VKYDLERAFRVVTTKDNCRYDAVHASVFDQPEYARFVALEPAVLAFERFENECVKIAEVIIDDCVDLSAKRWMMIFAGATGLRRVTGLVTRRMAGVSRMTRASGIAGQTRHTVAEGRGQDLSRIAAEGGDSAADDFEIALKHGIPSGRGWDGFADPLEDRKIPFLGE